ncbi:MAG: alpha/beta fold hydrolase [Burkholderiaceae bacterium]
MRFTTDDGEVLHVHIQGHGSPIVMLHGWAANHEEWSSFVEALNSQHCVYSWDARAHGGHELKTHTPATVQRMAQDLRNMLQHFELTDVTLVGHSMGALTSWEYIRQFGTDRLSRLCLIDQSPKLVTDAEWSLGIYGDFDVKRAKAFLSELHEDFAEGVLRLCAHSLNQRARKTYDANTRGWQAERARLRELQPDALIDIWASLTAADYRDVLGQIDIPTLLIYGELSNFYTTETAHYVRSHIPRAELHVYEGTDHSPHLWQVERFVRELLECIEKGVATE